MRAIPRGQHCPLRRPVRRNASTALGLSAVERWPERSRLRSRVSYGLPRGVTTTRPPGRCPGGRVVIVGAARSDLGHGGVVGGAGDIAGKGAVGVGDFFFVDQLLAEGFLVEWGL